MEKSEKSFLVNTATKQRSIKLLSKARDTTGISRNLESGWCITNPPPFVFVKLWV